MTEWRGTDTNIIIIIIITTSPPPPPSPNLNEVMPFSLFSKRLSKMKGLVEKDVTAETTNPQDKTLFT